MEETVEATTRPLSALPKEFPRTANNNDSTRALITLTDYQTFKELTKLLILSFDEGI